MACSRALTGSMKLNAEFPDLAEQIERRIRNNLGTFSSPVYNHIGDPHDKWGADSGSNRLLVALRGGITYSQPTGFWKDIIDREQRSRAKHPTTPAAAAPAPPPAAAPPPPTAGAAMPPGWYYVPSAGPDGLPTKALTCASCRQNAGPSRPLALVLNAVRSFIV